MFQGVSALFALGARMQMSIRREANQRRKPKGESYEFPR